MANDDNQHLTTPAPPETNPFDGALDPFGITELDLQFLKSQGHLLNSDSVQDYVDVMKRMMNSYSETEGTSERKKAKIEGDGKAEVLAVPPPTAAVEKDGPPAPNKVNKLDMVHMDNYSWRQTPEFVKIAIPVPPTTMTRDVTCEIRDDHIKFGLKGQHHILDGELFKPIKADDSFWYFEEKKPPVFIILMKQENQEDWWQCIVKGEAEIDT